MALPENARRMLQPLGLLVAVMGVIVALWAFTGERALEFSYFWVGLTGLLLVVGGVVLAAFGRATAPRGRAARRRPKPEAKAKPEAAKQAPARPAKDAPLPKADRVKLKHLGATLGLKRKKPEPAPEPAAEPAAEAPPAPAKPLTIECPTCTTRFEVPAGVREAKCPQCGALGDVPSEGAHA